MGRVFEALGRATGVSWDAAPAGFDSASLLRDTDWDTSELERSTCVTVKSAQNGRLVAMLPHQNLGAEKVRLLTMNLLHRVGRRAMKTILVTSSVKAEGKSFVAANLAISLARTSQRVLLVDGDYHQSTSAALFSADGFPGLTDWWHSGGPVLNRLVRINGLSLWLLPAGQEAGHSIEMLQSRRLAEMLTQLNGWFQWIIIDSPPCAPLADASAWSSLADGILLVARNGRTPQRLLKKVLESLDPNKIVGIVLNDCTDPGQSYYTQYYSGHRKAQSRT